MRLDRGRVRATGSVVEQATLVGKEEEAVKAARCIGRGRSVMAIFGMWVTHKPRLVP